MHLPELRPFHAHYVSALPEATSDLLFVFVDELCINNKTLQNFYLENLDTSLNFTISSLVSLGDFEGKWLQSSVSLSLNPQIAKRIVLIGTGKKDDFIPARSRQLGIKLAELMLALKAVNVSCLCSSFLLQSKEQLIQLSLGASLGVYKYPNSNARAEEVSSVKLPLNIYFVHEKFIDNAFMKKTSILERSLNLCRLLQDGPPNIVNPKYVAHHISQEAFELGLQVNVFGATQLREMGFGAMLAVGGGSAQEPQLVVVEYKPENYTKTLVFVGKGLTMDTGGYSIKTPSTNQEGMKYDMSGAAVCLSSVMAIAKLKLPIRVFAVGALCENMVDAHSYRVGDVLTSYSGKTIEVIDTDAEGRIVLSDALHFAAKDLKADYIVEYSTLTGAMIIALGHVGAGVFAFDKKLEETVISASEQTGERAFAFPVWDEVAQEMKGTISDLVNIGTTRRAAGSMAAAAFLKEFVDDVPYVHIDIAGVADGNSSIGYVKKGGSGYGVQLSVEIARQLSQS